MSELICTNCSRCCKEWTVPIVESDIDNIKSALNIDNVENIIEVGPLMEMEINYFNGGNIWCNGLEGKLILKLKKNSNNVCIFWDEQNKCKIYEYRPACCQIFPYWEDKGALVFDISAAHVKCELELRGIELVYREKDRTLKKIEIFNKELDKIKIILNQPCRKDNE